MWCRMATLSISAFDFLLGGVILKTELNKARSFTNQPVPSDKEGVYILCKRELGDRRNNHFISRARLIMLLLKVKPIAAYRHLLTANERRSR